jgi:hypothetical protein
MVEQRCIPAFILRVVYDIIAEETPNQDAVNRTRCRKSPAA